MMSVSAAIAEEKARKSSDFPCSVKQAGVTNRADCRTELSIDLFISFIHCEYKHFTRIDPDAHDTDILLPDIRIGRELRHENAWIL